MGTSAGKVVLFALVALLFLATFFLQTCSKPAERQESPAGDAILSDDHYVGSETCQSCHQEAYEDWRNSHHDLAMMEAGHESVKANFDTVFKSQGVTSRFHKKDGKYYVNTQGPQGEYNDYEVVYTFGVEPLQQYIVRFPDGRLQCLRTAWDTEKGRWYDLYPDTEIHPDEWLHWSGGGLTWNTMCADCHSTNVRKNYNEETESFNTAYSIIDVGCEACHGPGKKHLETVTAQDFDESKYDAARDDLYLTSGLTAKEQVDQCARCHSRRTQYTEAYNHQGQFMDHYAPDILRDRLYHADGQILDEVYVYGSFVQSKMYQMGVKCSDCHNSHSLELKAIGNALCQQCHAPEKYDTPDHHFHTINTEASQCASCHMTGRTYMGVDFRRDHSFRVPRPDLSVKYDTPNACNQCHTDKTADWAAEAVVAWYGPDRAPHFSEALAMGNQRTGEAVQPLINLLRDAAQPGIAKATAVWYLDQIVTRESIEAIIESLGSEDALVRHTAVNALADMPREEKINYLAPALADSVRIVRLAAANALADAPIARLDPQNKKEFEHAVEEYKKSLAVRADFPGGQFEKGQFFDRSGNDHLAEQAYLKAIRLDDRLNAARVNLAHLYNRQGQNDKAIGLFETVIEQEPEFAAAYYSIGLLYAEENKMDTAIEYLSKASELEDNPRIFYNLGIAYQQTGQVKKAEEAYLKGLANHASDYDLMYALSVLYIQNELFGKARPYVEKLIEAFPENRQLRQMKKIVASNGE